MMNASTCSRRGGGARQQADAVGSYPLYERCCIEIERCGRSRCQLEWPSRSSRRCAGA